MPEKTTDRIPGWQGAESARGLGAELRAKREELGWALPDVAGWLRIRESYLQALEEGNMSVFPGSAYALGFLRSYAHALGIDPDQAVARFRHDTRGALDRKPELSFPEPVSERGVPVGLWVGAGLAVLVGTYIGYYHFFGSEPAPTHQMPSVAEIMPGVTQHGTPSPQIAAVMPDRGLAPSPQPTEKGDSTTTGSLSASSANPASATGPAQENATPSGAVSAAAPRVSAQNVPAVNGQVAGEQTNAGQTMAPQAGASNLQGAGASGNMAPSQPGMQGDGTAGQAGAGVMPSSEASSASSSSGNVVASNMIGLHAAADAWVSIRDKNGATVFSRVLKAGETWQGSDDAAPYRMTLGNAGGLTLSAGDVTTAALGRIGAVRRNLVVSAAAIRNGQLGQEGSSTVASPSMTAPASASSSGTPVASGTHVPGSDVTRAGTGLKNEVAAPKLTTPTRRNGPADTASHESETDRLNARQLERTAQPQ